MSEQIHQTSTFSNWVPHNTFWLIHLAEYFQICYSYQMVFLTKTENCWNFWVHNCRRTNVKWNFNNCYFYPKKWRLLRKVIAGAERSHGFAYYWSSMYRRSPFVHGFCSRILFTDFPWHRTPSSSKISAYCLLAILHSEHNCATNKQFSISCSRWRFRMRARNRVKTEMGVNCCVSDSYSLWKKRANS